VNANETETRYRVDFRLKRRPERCRHTYKVRRMRVKEALPSASGDGEELQAGHPLDKKTLYGMRERGVR